MDGPRGTWTRKIANQTLGTLTRFLNARRFLSVKRNQEITGLKENKFRHAKSTNLIKNYWLNFSNHFTSFWFNYLFVSFFLCFFCIFPDIFVSSFLSSLFLSILSLSLSLSYFSFILSSYKHRCVIVTFYVTEDLTWWRGVRHKIVNFIKKNKIVWQPLCL